MTGNKPDSNKHTTDQVAQLLKQAQSRAPAPADVKERAFEQLHAHWSETVNHRRTKRRSMIWGVAATTLIALGAVLTSFDRAVPQPLVQVAEVVLVSGTELQMKADAQNNASSLTTADKLMLGSVIRTGDDSRLTLRWGQGGSLRVAQNTEFEITAKNQIQLREGSVYFDSMHGRAVHDLSVTFSVDTPFGNVTHVGTQFITQVLDNGLQVFVREGLVKIRSSSNEWITRAGNGLGVSADGAAHEFEISNYGEDWQWVQDMAPAYNSEGRTALSLLNWISQETGYTVEFETQHAMNVASGTILRGMNPLSPMSALQALPVVSNLRYELLNGVVYIHEDGD